MNHDALTALQQQLTAALENPPAELRRIFHGRGRRWAGLEQVTVDWLEGVVLVSLFREVADEELAALKAMLLDLADAPAWRHSGARTLLLQHRYLLESTVELLRGEAVEECVVSEGGL